MTDTRFSFSPRSDDTQDVLFAHDPIVLEPFNNQEYPIYDSENRGLHATSSMFRDYPEDMSWLDMDGFGGRSWQWWGSTIGADFPAITRYGISPHQRMETLLRYSPPKISDYEDEDDWSYFNNLDNPEEFEVKSISATENDILDTVSFSTESDKTSLTRVPCIKKLSSSSSYAHFSHSPEPCETATIGSGISERREKIQTVQLVTCGKCGSRLQLSFKNFSKKVIRKTVTSKKNNKPYLPTCKTCSRQNAVPADIVGPC